MDENKDNLPQDGTEPIPEQPATPADTLAQRILDSVPPIENASSYYAQPNGQTVQYQAPQGAYTQPNSQTVQYQAPQGAYTQPNGQTVQYQAPQGTYAQPNGQTVQYQTPQGTYAQSNGQTAQYQTPPPPSPTGSYPMQRAVPPQENGFPEKKTPKKLKGWMLSLIIAGGVLILAGLIVGGIFLVDALTHHDVDLSELYHIEIEGYDGYAKAQLVKDDWDANEVFENAEQAALASTLQGELNKEEKIKNGDVITATFTYDEAYADQVGVRFKNTELSVTAEGLEKADIIDPFENLALTYSGISPVGTVTISDGNEDLFYYFIAGEQKYFANGDTVTIAASYDETEIQQAGGIVLEDTKTYTIEGLASYITDKEQLTTQINSLISEATAAKLSNSLKSNSFSIIYEINSPDYSYLANVSVKDIKLDNTYIASRKEAQDWGTYNTIFHLYSMNITLSQDGKEETFPMYAMVAARNVILENDGSLRTLDSSNVSFYFSSSFSDDKDELYENCVETMSASCNIVSLN